MEDAGNSFFHMLCGAVLFVAAVFCLVVGIRAVTAGITVCRAYMEEEVVYETAELPAERLVSGAYVIAQLMAEPQYTVCIEQGNDVIVIRADENPVQRLASLEIHPMTVFCVSCVYGQSGDLMQMRFVQVVE